MVQLDKIESDFNKDRQATFEKLFDNWQLDIYILYVTINMNMMKNMISRIVGIRLDYSRDLLSQRLQMVAQSWHPILVAFAVNPGYLFEIVLECIVAHLSDEVDHFEVRVQSLVRIPQDRAKLVVVLSPHLSYIT